MNNIAILSRHEADDDRRWMALALGQAREAARAGEVPVGAVVVKDGVLLGLGRNTPVAMHDPSGHAEINALRAAAAKVGNYRLDGCTLYVTLEPCAMCAGAMLHARLARVVFGAADPRTGAAGSVVDLFASPALNHHTRVDGGVESVACAAILQDFFRARRQAAREAAQPLRDDALRTPPKRFSPFEAAWPETGAICELPSLGGLRLAFSDVGATGQGAAVLGLHGWGQWGYLFRHLPAPLAARRLLVPDLIGCGRSDKPKREAAHRVNWHAQVIEEWLLSRGVPQVIVAHHPDATELVMALAARGRVTVLAQAPVACHPADDTARAAWRAPFPDRGFEAVLRAQGRRGMAQDDLDASAAMVLAARLQGMGG